MGIHTEAFLTLRPARCDRKSRGLRSALTGGRKLNVFHCGSTNPNVLFWVVSRKVRSCRAAINHILYTSRIIYPVILNQSKFFTRSDLPTLSSSATYTNRRRGKKIKRLCIFMIWARQSVWHLLWHKENIDTFYQPINILSDRFLNLKNNNVI